MYWAFSMTDSKEEFDDVEKTLGRRSDPCDCNMSVDFPGFSHYAARHSLHSFFGLSRFCLAPELSSRRLKAPEINSGIRNRERQRAAFTGMKRS